MTKLVALASCAIAACVTQQPAPAIVSSPAPRSAPATTPVVTIDVEAERTRSRALLAKQAETICHDCDDEDCARDALADNDRWERELLTAGADQARAMRADPEIWRLREWIDECRGTFFARPAAKACRQRLAQATADFLREAPRVFPIYKTLDWTLNTDEEPLGSTIASARVTPGRSWDFRAVVGSDAVLDELEIPHDKVLTEGWQTLPDEMGTLLVRKRGSTVIALRIRSERWGQYTETDHPLTKLFFAKLRAVASSCQP